MALTLSNSVQPSRAGPGYQMILHISAGPVPNDDFINCAVRLPGASNVLTSGTQRTFGALTVILTLGYLDSPTFFGRQQGVDFASVGATVDIEAQQFHASGVLVQSMTTLHGWTWDPTGGLFILVQSLQVQIGKLLGGTDTSSLLSRQFPDN